MRRLRPDAFVLIFAVGVGLAAFAPAPRSAPQTTAPLPLPVPAASASASLSGRSGAPLANETLRGRATAEPGHESRASGTSGPAGAVTRMPRPSVRPTSSPARVAQSAERRPRKSQAPGSTPGPSSILAGTASWYCLPGRSSCTRGYPASGAYAAAGPAVRAALGDWRGRRAVVSTGRVDIVVTLIDWCSCPGGRLVDLYASAYSQLDSLSTGLLDVTVALP